MSIDVSVATGDELDRWNSYVAQSPQGTVCHEIEPLRVLAEHANGTLHPLIGYKGQEPVGLFPVFEIRKRFVTTAFSPPPHLRVPYLGPAYLNVEKLKRRKRDRRKERFLEGCFEWIRGAIAPKYTHVRTGPAVADSRPFKWNDYETTPKYTYVVDLSPGREEVLQQFSSDARNNVTNAPPERYDVEVGGETAIRQIVEQVRRRYESQGIGFDVPAEFVVDLYEAANRGDVRPFTITVDDEFVGGILALEYGETTSRWIGGVRTDADVDLPTNDLLDWAIMERAIDDGLAAYDLVGADTRRINRYKSKFNPSLRTYYGFERGSWAMRTAASLYESIK